MTPHPLQNAIYVWAAEPDVWQWQEHRKGSSVWHTKHPNSPPAIHLLESFDFRLVPRAWLNDPVGVEVWFRDRGSTLPLSLATCGYWWDHDQLEYDIRLKPRTITLPERVVPEPLREEPKAGSIVWIAAPHHKDFVYGEGWETLTLRRAYARGLLYADSIAAATAAKAMIGWEDRP